ncbi:ATP-binding cassette domain-containing protein [Catenovulum sediminis]|uniref:ATP-binding cassette domain-containing protein n=1 Tax=Catenovulum sediminis TaxID=1740262 RepID=UPI00117E98A1|nr:ATP-binding cassette domain-containing protein [Catenovulum sediminis]
MNLKVDNFYLAFGDLVLFENAALKLERGKMICLSTGVLDGGTSFLKACAGIVPYQQGQVLIENQDLQNMSDDQRFKHITYCYEVGGLVSLFSVYNNIALPLRYHRSLPNKIIHQRILSAASDLGVLNLLDYEPYELNDVQTRLINLVRALVIRPRVILADELQSGMSPGMRSNVIQVLEEYCAKTNASVLMTTTAGDETAFADQVYYIENRQIKAE